MAVDGERRPVEEPRPLLLDRHLLSTAALARLAALALLLIAVYWTADLLLLEEPPPLDLLILETATEIRSAVGGVAIARALTLIGDLWFVALIGLVVVVIAHRRAGHWDSAWLTIGVVGGALLVTAVVKAITVRARPDDALIGTISHAFPSGHASRAAAACALVAWLAVRWGRRPVTRIGLAVTAVTLGIGVGVSRVALGAHWATDVIGGWALGLVWFAGCLAITRPHRAAGADVAER